MSLPKKIDQREYDKFVADADGNTCIRTSSAASSSDSEDYQNYLGSYQVNDLDDGDTTASVLYIGMTKSDGTWCVKKFDETTAATPVISYATVTNNAAVTTYAAAWAAIGTLTYGRFDEAF